MSHFEGNLDAKTVLMALAADPEAQVAEYAMELLG